MQAPVVVVVVLLLLLLAAILVVAVFVVVAAAAAAAAVAAVAALPAEKSVQLSETPTCRLPELSSPSERLACCFNPIHR